MSRVLSLRRTLVPSAIRSYATSFRPQPAPQKLPAEQQAEFERLQRSAAVSSAFQPQESSSSSASSSSTTTTTESSKQGSTEEDEDVNQGLFRGAKPEFKGDTNPKTGEVGGPKNEPLRWGGQGDWSYNGRATDF